MVRQDGKGFQPSETEEVASIHLFPCSGGSQHPRVPGWVTACAAHEPLEHTQASVTDTTNALPGYGCTPPRIGRPVKRFSGALDLIHFAA
jgi:hypothetical protein